MDLNAKVFLSHSKHDEENAREIRDWLLELDLNTFASFDNIRRLEFWKVITKELRASACLLLIMTRNSLESANVHKEIILADKYNKKIFIYQIDEIEHYPDEVDAILTPIQRIEGFKYGHKEGLRRLADMLLVEAGLDDKEVTRAINAAIASSCEKQRKAENESKYKQERWKEEYLDYKWNGKSLKGKLARIEIEYLNDLASKLGLSNDETDKLQVLKKRNRKKFIGLLGGTLSTKTIGIKEIQTLDDRRMKHEISRKEVQEVIAARTKIPQFSYANLKQWIDAYPKLEWLLEALREKKIELEKNVENKFEKAVETSFSSSTSDPANKPNRGIRGRLDDARQPTTSSGIELEKLDILDRKSQPLLGSRKTLNSHVKEVTTKPPASEPESNAVDIQVVRARAAYRGRGKNEDFFGLEEINPSQRLAGGLNASFTLHVTPQEASVSHTRFIVVSLAGIEEKVYVNIPSDIKSGTQLRIKGKGHQAPSKKRGDLFLKIKVYDAPLNDDCKSSSVSLNEIKDCHAKLVTNTTLIPQPSKSTFILDWERNWGNTSATRKIIHEQNIQLSTLSELTGFNIDVAIHASFGRLEGIAEIKYGTDISALPVVRSTLKTFKLTKEKNLKIFFWYNDSIIRRKRGIIVSNRGISLQSFFQDPTLFLFGRHGFRLADNITISDKDNELRIDITGYTNTSSEPEQKTYVLSSPAKEQRPLIAAALKQFVGMIDSFYTCMSQLRISLARELRCSIGYRNLSSRDAIITYSPPHQLSSLYDSAKDHFSLTKLPLPNDDELIFLLRSSPTNNASLMLATIYGLYAVKRFGKYGDPLRSAKGVFISWSLLRGLRFCSKNDAHHFFQIRYGIDTFTTFAISWLLVDGSKEDFEEIARFVMSLKKRLDSIVRL